MFWISSPYTTKVSIGMETTEEHNVSKAEQLKTLANDAFKGN